MEIKDLFLLMLIPIMLVSLVVYTDKNPVIIGAVTAKQEESNILGTYSIMPSFKAKIDYNLEKDYKDIKGKLDDIIEDCKNSPNIEQCLKEKSDKKEWNCQEPKEEAINILYDFLDKFKDCMSLQEDGVVCRFSLDEREIISTPFRSYEIRLTNEKQRTRMELLGVSSDLKEGVKVLRIEYINLENLVYTIYDYKGTLNEKINPVRILIKFEGKKPIIEDVFAIDDNSNRIPLSKTFLLYKKDGYIKFVEAPGSSFEAPPEANKIIDLPKTKGFKFCAKTEKQFYIYDETDKIVKLIPIIYKFAVTYSSDLIDNIAPAKVENLRAEITNSDVKIKWSKPIKNVDGSTSNDISGFNIYYRKFSPSVFPNLIDASYNKKAVTIAEANCESLVKISCDYTLIGLEKNQIYDIAVTAVDKGSNEAIENADVIQINIPQT